MSWHRYKPTNEKRKDEIQANVAAQDDGKVKNNPMVKVSNALRARSNQPTMKIIDGTAR
jgi:hypothetical protein